MLTKEDVESYLMRLEQDVEEVEPGLWLIRSGQESVALVANLTPPLLLLRVKVMEVPEEERLCADLYRRLLELNAMDLVHGAYGIEEGNVILSDALELENLDFNELQASVDALQMALASHLESLAPFRDCEGTGQRDEGAAAPSPAV